MPTPSEIQQAIESVTDQATFVQNLLVDKLEWPIPEGIENIEEIAYNWGQDDLRAEGLDEHLVEGRVLQLMKMTKDQDWGVFILEFNNPDVFISNRGLTSPLRKTLRGLVPHKRVSTRAANLLAWERENLLFICTYNYEHFRFAYFKAPKGKEKTAPLALFGWNKGDTDIRTLCEHNLPFLKWNEDDPQMTEWRNAFSIEKVTKNFYSSYAEAFQQMEKAIRDNNNIKDEELRLFTQTLFNRLMFLKFVEKKHWLRFQESTDYLASLYAAGGIGSRSFYQSRLMPLFFEALAIQGKQESDAVGKVPFLNGGLFERKEGFDDNITDINNEAFELILGPDGLFNRYNFTVEESTPLDIEVAVDPEMLGKVFEELVTGRHESGSYYTPRSIVSFMCREALKGYLYEKTSVPKEAIEKLVDEHELEDGDLTEKDADDILYYLETLKAVDPACGSGAYLLGLLQELMAIRRTLQNQKLRADPAFHYELKLRAISRSLYGVDIDPFATNIAKLRLWLSLAVEADKPQPLPNLDFKIETGDAILGPCNELTNTDDLLFISDLKDRAEALVLKKDEYMTAHGDRKKQLYDEIKKEEDEIASETSTAYGENVIAWYVHFAEVFMTSRRQQDIQKGIEELKDYQVTTFEPTGFDIVLANPPYVRQELIKDIKPELQKIYPNTYSGTADLYTYFYTRAVELLGPGGMLSFISPNKWFRANYGKKIRNFLADQCTVHSITDFQDSPVFEGATAYPMIFVAQKGNVAHPTVYTETHVSNGNIDVKTVIKENGKILNGKSIKGENWSFVDEKAAARIAKMQIDSVPLEIYVKRQIYRGILTGFNKAFVIDNAKREELIAEDPASEDLIKPLLMGRDIKRWYSSSKNQWIIVTPIDVDIDNYPEIFRHLKRYQSELKKRLDQGHHWWELRACAYYEEFKKEKIVFPDIAPKSRFALDTDGCYLGNTGYIIPIADKYLLGILNSTLVNEFYTDISAQVRGGYLRFIYQYVAQIPIPKATDRQKKDVEKLVQKCLDAEGQDCEKWEAQIDKIVTKLYGLEE